MNRIIVLCLTTICMACNNHDQIRGQVEALSAKWEQTEAKLQDLDQTFNSTIRSANKEVGKRGLVDNDVKTHSEALYNKWINTKTGLMGVMSAFTPVQVEITDLKKKWSTRSDDLATLKESVENGSIGNDAESRIDDLESFRTGVDQNVDQLNASIDSSKVLLNKAVDNWIQTYDDIRQSMAGN